MSSKMTPNDKSVKTVSTQIFDTQLRLTYPQCESSENVADASLFQALDENNV